MREFIYSSQRVLTKYRLSKEHSPSPWHSRVLKSLFLENGHVPISWFRGGCSRFLQSEGWSRTSSVPHILCGSLQNLDFYFLTCWMRIWAWDALQTVHTALKFAKCTIPVPHSKHWVKGDLRAFQMLSPLPTARVWRRYFSQGLRCCCWVSDQQGHTALVLSYLVES